MNAILSTIDWTPDLAMDWAMLIQGRAIENIPPEDVAYFYNTYRLTQATFQRILNNAAFQREVNDNLKLLQDEGYVFRQKAAISAGITLERLIRKMKANQIETKEEIALLKEMVRYANLSEQDKEANKKNSQREAELQAALAGQKKNEFHLNISFTNKDEVKEVHIMEGELKDDTNYEPITENYMKEDANFPTLFRLSDLP